jgi:hypothetical protein
MLIRKKSNNFFLNEITRLENEVIMFGIIFGMVHERSLSCPYAWPHT